MRPAILKAEREWFARQLTSHVRLSATLPHGQFVDAFTDLGFFQRLRWSPWSRLTWKYQRAWSIARLSGRIPLTLWGFADCPEWLATCPGCWWNRADLYHLLAACPATDMCRAHVPEVVLSDCLLLDTDMEVLRQRVVLLGSCIATTAQLLAQMRQ